MKRRFLVLSILLLALSVVMMTAACGVKKPLGTKAEQCGTEPAKETLAASGRTAEASSSMDAERLEQERLKKLEAEKAYQTAMTRFESEMIHFNYDSDVLLPEAQDILRSKGEFLRTYEDVKIQIGGYCDERGSIEYNLALGERRALSAKNFLVNLGIDAARIATVSYGKENPVDPASTEEAYAKNRRDEFHVQ